MGYWYDFAIKYNPEKDTGIDLTKKVLFSIIIRRLMYKKPAVMFIAGKSGEGKTHTAVRIQQLLLELRGLDVRDYLQDINVFTPLEYPKKLNALLYDKRLKKVNIICAHEAREIVRAKDWQSFLTTSIADVNAMSRAIKRLCIMIISQNLKDIAREIRLTVNYYCKVTRPIGHNARLYINTMYEDDRDIDQPKIRKRRLTGYLVYPNGKYKKWTPKYLELSRLDKDIAKALDKADVDAKSGILRSKLNKLMEAMKKDIGDDANKLNAMLEWYLNNSDNLTTLGSVRKGKLTLNKEFKEMHSLSDDELKTFTEMINTAMKEKGEIKEGGTNE